MSMAHVLEAVNTTATCVPLLNFVFLRHSMVPILDVFARLIRLAINMAGTGHTPAELFPMFIVKTVKAQFFGDSTKVEAFKPYRDGPCLQLLMYKDPKNNAHQKIHDLTLRALTGSRLGKPACLELATLQSIVVPIVSGKPPHFIPASVIPTSFGQDRKSVV